MALLNQRNRQIYFPKSMYHPPQNQRNLGLTSLPLSLLDHRLCNNLLETLRHFFNHLTNRGLVLLLLKEMHQEVHEIIFQPPKLLISNLYNFVNSPATSIISSIRARLQNCSSPEPRVISSSCRHSSASDGSPSTTSANASC